MESRFKNIETATEGTCGWLLEHDMYQRWALVTEAYFGSMESPVLASQLYCAMRSTILWRPRAWIRCFLFFFHGRGTQLENTQIGLFRSVLHQIFKQAPKAWPELIAVFEERQQTRGPSGKKWDWGVKELESFFEPAISRLLGKPPAWFFIDALDEAGKDQAIKLAEKFQFLFESFRHSRFPLYINFSSRHYPILKLHDAFEVCLEHETSDAISTYVQTRLFESQIITKLNIPRPPYLINLLIIIYTSITKVNLLLLFS